ncbi:MAG: Gfo/Idh/MocA family oxidoreductase, partial [Oscillospiraceae bacterium]
LMGNPKPISVYGATFQKLFNRPNIKGEKGYCSVSSGEKDICDVEDLASALIRYDNGAVLSIEASFSLNIKEDEGKIQLFGTKGGAKIDSGVEMYTDINDYMANVNLTIPTSLSFNGLFQNEINHYVDCLINGTACKSPASDGIAIMKILDAVYESARTGHEVVID